VESYQSDICSLGYDSPNPNLDSHSQTIAALIICVHITSCVMLHAISVISQNSVHTKAVVS